ncbi:TRAP transporter small permease subunit [Aureimonas populi]|uniref:TRAP transporter small permease protein n=1 Tax=Aureimonas populi TaxID=1701758 RepID=A0ABW5CGW5_9HYPH|nr:TRAP transporter small permease subunit [Aureimonas populi]
MRGVIEAYVRVVDRLSDWVGIVAMYLVYAMGAVLLADAIARNTFSLSLHWGVELVQFMLAAYYFMGGAKTLKDEDHVRMDLIYSRFGPRGRAVLDFATVWCLLFFLVVLLIGSTSSLEYAISTNERRFSMWNPSMIPIKALMVGCIALMILQTLALACRYGALALARTPLR